MTTLIGKTGRISNVLHQRIPVLKDKATPVGDRRYLFLGKPGLGKTTLAKQLGLSLTGGNALGVDRRNGQSVSVEVVRDWETEGHYHPMYGVRVIIVDEIEKASPAALNQIRTYLDDLPTLTVFIATTNCTIEELPEQLQSRFKPYYFLPVEPEEVKAWVEATFKLSPKVAGSIAVSCKGNVRAAECEALAVLENISVNHTTINK